MISVALIVFACLFVAVLKLFFYLLATRKETPEELTGHIIRSVTVEVCYVNSNKSPDTVVYELNSAINIHKWLELELDKGIWLNEKTIISKYSVARLNIIKVELHDE